ncbi:MAG: hypothetical protein WBC92_13270 [Terracidiphilus sp.]
MYLTCRHIKTNGLRCESPALKGGHFCYYHSKTRIVGAEPEAKYGPLHLPIPEDPGSVQLSIAMISDALINGRIDLKNATGLFYGLQIAAQFIDRHAYFPARETVQSAEQTAQGDELAPQEYGCNDDEDCNECPYSDDCPRCIDSDEDDECEDEEEEDDSGDDEDAQEEESEEDEIEEEDEKEENQEPPKGPLRKKQEPVTDGLDALRKSLAKVLDQRCRAG